MYYVYCIHCAGVLDVVGVKVGQAGGCLGGAAGRVHVFVGRQYEG